MVDSRCPGQDMQNWKPGDIFDVKCPWCGYEIEFWKDEPARPCRSCGKEVRNPRIDLGCAKWCKSAKECLGVMLEAPDSAASVRERVIAAMRGTFGDDGRRIEHALRVLEFAERILVTETADPVVVKAAAVLHDIGIHEAERKHASAAGPFQELEGPPIARHLLERIGLDPSSIDHVCRIVGSHHSANDIDTPEFRIIWDADWLVNIPDEYPNLAKDDLARLIERVFRTAKGRSLAHELYLE